MPFTELPPQISAALSERGYAEPTPVQSAVLEPEARDRDLVVSAQTGSGKTVAFGMAMSRTLLAEGLPVPGTPLALVIAPTRELALQVSQELAWLYAKAGARITTCVGGMDPSKERRALMHGTHIVVGTPGRLRDHLERGALDLSGLAFVVLDEADEMLDMGFREDLEEILDATPPQRRTMLFSATMPKPIVALARRYQRDALRISTIDDNRGHGDISYQTVAVAPADIEHAVINLLRFHEAETAMLFCATRDNVRHLHAALVERGFAAVALSGEHSQNERNHALQGRAKFGLDRAWHLKERLIRCDPDGADLVPGDVAAAAQKRQDPARVGILSAADVHAEPYDVFEPGTVRRPGTTSRVRPGGKVDQFLRLRQSLAMRAHQRRGDIQRPFAFEQPFRQDALLIARLDRFQQRCEQPFVVSLADGLCTWNFHPLRSNAGPAQHIFHAVAAREGYDDYGDALSPGPARAA